MGASVMSSVYGFDIPHEAGEPCRDIIAIQLPYPPSRVRSLWIPDVAREFGQHGVQCGIIRQMGPLAFQYKDGNGVVLLTKLTISQESGCTTGTRYPVHVSDAWLSGATTLGRLSVRPQPDGSFVLETTGAASEPVNDH